MIQFHKTHLGFISSEISHLTYTDFLQHFWAKYISAPVTLASSFSEHKWQEAEWCWQKSQTWDGYQQEVIREKWVSETSPGNESPDSQAHLGIRKKELGGGNITQGHNQGLMLIETETKLTCEKEGGGLASRGDILHTQSGGCRQQKHSCIIKHCLPRKHLHLRTIHPGRCLSNESCKSTEHRQAALWSQNTVIRKSHKMGFRKSLWGVLSGEGREMFYGFNIQVCQKWSR